MLNYFFYQMYIDVNLKNYFFLVKIIDDLLYNLTLEKDELI